MNWTALSVSFIVSLVVCVDLSTKGKEKHFKRVGKCHYYKRKRTKKKNWPMTQGDAVVQTPSVFLLFFFELIRFQADHFPLTKY